MSDGVEDLQYGLLACCSHKSWAELLTHYIQQHNPNAAKDVPVWQTVVVNHALMVARQLIVAALVLEALLTTYLIHEESRERQSEKKL